MTNTVDGALLEGPTFTNPLRNEFTDDRDTASPAWLPVYERGQVVRFEDGPGDFDESPVRGDTHASPISRTRPIRSASSRSTSCGSRPDWLDQPRGPDVSPDMTWIPAVTFWQVLADLAFSTGVPDGHGHSYGVFAVDGWAAVAAPPGWTSDDTACPQAGRDARH